MQLRLLLAQVLSCLFLSCIPSVVWSAPDSFDEAKRLAERVYADHPEEFYCGCQIKWNKSGKDLVDLRGCGYQIRKDPARAQRVEWEHVVPASWFGQKMACWKQGGRKQCAKRDKTFQRIEADLHNLTPSIGEVNGDRGNLPFGIVASELGRYGKCTTRVDFAHEVVEPRDAVKGDAARIAFYMAEKYQVVLDAKQRALLEQWSMQDPVDAWEIKRDERIGQHMGWRNPFVVRGKAVPELPASGTKWVARADTNVDAKIARQPVGKTRGGDSLVTVASRVGIVRGNRNSKAYHFSHCPDFNKIKPANRVEFASAELARLQGFRLAGNCK